MNTWVQMIGAALAALISGGIVLRWLGWAKLKEAIDERIDTKIKPMQDQMSTYDKAHYELLKIPDIVQGIGQQMTEKMAEVKDSVKEANAELKAQGKELAEFRGAFNERRKSQP